nr:RecName: Full=Ferredoxin [Anabaena sp. L-31]
MATIYKVTLINETEG